jgi:XTP/dITP diphosphohydrolase
VPVALAVVVHPALPGLLGPAAWRALSGGRPVVALPGAAAAADALRADGWAVDDVPDAAAAAARPDSVVALVPAGTEVDAGEVVDAPVPRRRRLLDVVRVMDVLRSPGGCPWDAEQTHASLRGYLLEEAHEAYDAIVDDDPAGMREELGDVLLQVVFHARVAAEGGPDRRFTVDDVAGDLVDKLVRRHPHVFGDAGPRDVAQVEAAGRRSRSPRSSAARRPRAVPFPARGVRGARRWSAAPRARACPRRSRRSSPRPAPRSWGSGCWASSPPRRQRGWDVEDALREAVRRYAGELDAEAEARAGG